MADIKCTKCGGTLKFQQGDTVGVCESCGAEQTLAHLDETEEKCIAPAKPTKILNKQIVIRTLIVCACVALVILGIIYRISLGIKINDRHFPDRALSNSVRILDLNQNGYLSKKELAEADTLGIWGPCRDLSGIEYLTNLKSLGINGCQFSDLSGVEYLTNLEELHLSNIYGQCPDLSALENLTNLKELRIYESVFSEKFVFDNDISVTNLNFKYCVFEKGILFKNNSVGNEILAFTKPPPIIICFCSFINGSTNIIQSFGRPIGVILPYSICVFSKTYSRGATDTTLELVYFLTTLPILYLYPTGTIKAQYLITSFLLHLTIKQLNPIFLSILYSSQSLFPSAKSGLISATKNLFFSSKLSQSLTKSYIHFGTRFLFSIIGLNSKFPIFIFCPP